MKKVNPNAKEGVSYLFWCIMTTAVSWLTYSLFAYLFGLTDLAVAVVVSIASVLSWVCAVTFSFTANKILVFKSKSWAPKVLIPELLKFYSTRFAVGLIEIVLVPIMVTLGLNQTLFGVEGMVSKIIVTPIVILLNYTLGKFFVFKKK